MRHCETCGFLGISGYEYPESYCKCGIQDDDPKLSEDAEGTGCTYNLRTLRKRLEKIEEAEEISMIGYNDYILMNSSEYTEEGEKELEVYRKLIRHALGMDHKKPYVRHDRKFYKAYRNYFTTHEKAHDYPYWEKLTLCGLAERFKTGCYAVTKTGMLWLGQHDGISIREKE